MTKLKIIFITTIAVAGAAVSFWIQHWSHARRRASDALLQEQRRQMAALTAEHERLSNLAARPSNLPADDHSAEVTRLRREAEALKKQTNDLGQQSGRSHESRSSQPTSNPKSHTPEYYEQLHQMAGSKSTEAVYLGAAFPNYAMDHQNQSPSNLDQLVPYLAKENRSLSGSNQFEIIYHGSLDNLQGIPWGSVAVVREQQPWPGPDGKMMRQYGMMGGLGRIVESDDNFQSWEAIHVIAPPADGASGQ